MGGASKTTADVTNCDVAREVVREAVGKVFEAVSNKNNNQPTPLVSPRSAEGGGEAGTAGGNVGGAARAGQDGTHYTFNTFTLPSGAQVTLDNMTGDTKLGDLFAQLYEKVKSEYDRAKAKASLKQSSVQSPYPSYTYHWVNSGIFSITNTNTNKGDTGVRVHELDGDIYNKKLKEVFGDHTNLTVTRGNSEGEMPSDCADTFKEALHRIWEWNGNDYKLECHYVDFVEDFDPHAMGSLSIAFNGVSVSKIKDISKFIKTDDSRLTEYYSFMSSDLMWGDRGSIYYLSIPALLNNKSSCPAYLIIPALTQELDKPLMLVIVRDAQGQIRGAKIPPERTISQQAEDDVTAIDTLAKKYLDSITDPSLTPQNINIAAFEAKLLELLETTCTPKRGYPGYTSTLLKTYVNLMCSRIINDSYDITTDPPIVTSLGTWKGNDNTLFSRIKQPDDDDILKSFREMVQKCILPCSDKSETTEIQAKNEEFKNYLDHNMNALASILNKDVINGKFHGSVYSRTSTLEDIITKECSLKRIHDKITEKFRRILWCYQRELWLRIDDDILKSFREMVQKCILPCSDESEKTKIQAKNEEFKNYLDHNMNALASILNKDVINGKLRHHGSVYIGASTLEDIITEERSSSGQGIHITENFRRILWCYQRALLLHIKMIDMHPALITFNGMYDKHKKALEADVQSISIPPEDAQDAYQRMYDKHKQALEADIQSISIPPEDVQAAYKRIGYGYLEAAYAQIRLGRPCLLLLHSPSDPLLVNGAWYIIDDIYNQSKSLRRCQSSSQVVQGDQASQVVQGDQDYLLVDLYFHQKSEDLRAFVLKNEGIKTLCQGMVRDRPLNEVDIHQLILKYSGYSGNYRENDPDGYGRDQKVISEALSGFIESKITANTLLKGIYTRTSKPKV